MAHATHSLPSTSLGALADWLDTADELDAQPFGSREASDLAHAAGVARLNAQHLMQQALRGLRRDFPGESTDRLLRRLFRGLEG